MNTPQFRKIGKHHAELTRESLERDSTEPSTIGRHVKVCGDIGPCIGDEGSTRCGRVMHHDGNHHTNPEWTGFNQGWPGAQQGGYDKTDHDYRDNFGGPILP